MDTSILFRCSGTKGMSKNPGLCSLKWTEDWCLASLGLSVGDLTEGVGCCLPSPLAWPVGCNGTSSELSVRDVANRSVCFHFLDILRSTRSPRFIRLSPELSIRDVERVAKVEVRLAPGLSIGRVRGKE